MEERIDPNSDKEAVRDADTNGEQELNCGNGAVSEQAASGANANGYSTKYIFAISFASILAGVLSAPSILALNFGFILISIAGWSLALLSLWKSRGADRVLSWLALIINTGGAALMCFLTFGLSHYDLTGTMIVMIPCLLIPAAVLIMTLFIKRRRDKDNVSAIEFILLAVMIAAVGCLVGFLSLRYQTGKYLDFEPGTKWVCNDPEVVLETREGPVYIETCGYFVKDGERHEISICTENGEVLFFDKTDGGDSQMIMSGLASFSDGGKTMNLHDMEYEYDEYDLGAITLVFRRVDDTEG